jgi:hypothetical protein
VKTTRAARGSTNVSVVVRRRFEPSTAIHVRDESKCLTRLERDVRPLEPLEERCCEDDDEDDGEDEPLPATAAPASGVWTVATAVVTALVTALVGAVLVGTVAAGS